MAITGRQKVKLCGMMCIVLLALFVSCTTKKNTSATRAYHALTAHYNTLYNGQVAYLEGLQLYYPPLQHAARHRICGKGKVGALLCCA